MKKNFEFAGIVQYISSSPHGEIDGLVLADSTFVKIPPHAVLEPGLIFEGLNVEGSGELIGESPNRVVHHVRLYADQKLLADDRKDPEEKPRRPNHQKVQGRLVSIGAKPKGELDRMILDDGTSVHVPKHIEINARKMKLGKTYEVTGELRTFDKLRFMKAEYINEL